MELQVIATNKVIVRSFCLIFIALNFLRYIFPIIDNAILGLTIIDLIYFTIICFIILFHKKPFSAYVYGNTYIFIILYSLPIFFQIITHIYNFGIYGSLIYLKLLSFPLLFNLIDFSYQERNYIKSFKDCFMIFIYSLSSFLLIKLVDFNFFAKTNLAVIPIIGIGFLLIQIADFLSIYFKKFKFYSFILTLILFLWCISDSNRMGLIIFGIQLIFKNIKFIKDIFKGKIKKLNLIILLFSIIPILSFLGKFINVVTSLTSLRTRLLGVYLMKEKILSAGFLGHGLNSSLHVGLETFKQIDIAKMNSLHNSIASLIITCGYLAFFAMLITWFKLINLEKLLISSKEYNQILNIRFFIPILILSSAPLGNETINMILSFLLMQWIFSPINIYNYLCSLKLNKSPSIIS